MKKIVVGSAILGCALMMCACGASDNSADETKAQAETVAEQTSDAVDVTTEPTKEPAEQTIIPETSAEETKVDETTAETELSYIYGSGLQCRFDVNFLNSELVESDEQSGVEIWNNYYDIVATDIGYDLRGTLRIPNLIPSDVIEGLLNETVTEFDINGVTYTLVDTAVSEMGRYTYTFEGSDGRTYQTGNVLDPIATYYMSDEDGIWYSTVEDYLLSVRTGSFMEMELGVMLDGTNQPVTTDFAVTFGDDGVASDIRPVSASAVLPYMADM